MWENTSVARKARFVRHVAAVAEQIRRSIVHQFPGFPRVAKRNLLGIPSLRPRWILFVVVSASDKLSSLLGKPECFSRVTGHRHGTTIFDGDAKDFRFTGIGQRQFIAKSGNEDGRRRAAFACG